MALKIIGNIGIRDNSEIDIAESGALKMVYANEWRDVSKWMGENGLCSWPRA